MAWLERRTPDGRVEVRVIEARGTTVWERSARGASPGRGRVALLGQHPTDADAARAAAARVAKLGAAGYRVIDATAGVDARRPGGRPTTAVPARPTAGRLTADELARLLARTVEGLPGPVTAGAVLGLFSQAIALPRGYRSRGYHCDLTVRGTAFLAVILAGVGDGSCGRELGYDMSYEIPDDRETLAEDIRGEDGERWAVFARALREADAWQAVRDLRCTRVEIHDHEID